MTSTTNNLNLIYTALASKKKEHQDDLPLAVIDSDTELIKNIQDKIHEAETAMVLVESILQRNKKFVVPDNFRDAINPIQLSAAPKPTDRVFQTFSEAKGWLIDTVESDVMRWEAKRSHCYTFQDDRHAAQMQRKYERMLEAFQGIVSI